jgi:2'-5' RNA ligase
MHKGEDQLKPGAAFVRLFAAITLPDEVRAELVRVQRELAAVLGATPVSWTKPDNLHLTLRFLGDVAEERLSEVQLSLAAAAAAFGELNLVCEGLGGFPDLRFPRVLWAGVQDADARLMPLFTKLNAALSPYASKPAEEHFSGHITLARPKRLRRSEVDAVARFVQQKAGGCFGRWRAGEVHLIRSELRPAGSRYTTLARAPLAR